MCSSRGRIWGCGTLRSPTTRLAWPFFPPSTQAETFWRRAVRSGVLFSPPVMPLPRQGRLRSPIEGQVNPLGAASLVLGMRAAAAEKLFCRSPSEP